MLNFHNTLNAKIKIVCEICDFLKTQQDLSPNNSDVNLLLNALVQNVGAWQTCGSLSVEDVQKSADYLLSQLPKLCAKAECEMEKWWSRQIIVDQEKLHTFWYFENYKNLIEAENKLLENQTLSHITFLGSGAFPLSAILLAQKTDRLVIRCIDADGEACDLSKALVDKLQLSGQIKIEQQNADDLDASFDDLVICASLLETKRIYDRLYRHSIDRLIVRDAEGLYRLLYSPALRPSPQLYVEKRKTSLSNVCINTSVYYERTVSDSSCCNIITL